MCRTSDRRATPCWGALLTCAWLALVGAGCGDSEPETKPLCYRGNPPEAAGMIVEPRPEEWIAFLTNGTSGTSADHDCAGNLVRWPEAPPECDAAETASDLPFEPVVLGEDAVIERRLPSGERLLWVITHVRGDGFAMGPLALVEVTDRGAAVTALGTLRSRYERLRLSMWTLADGQVLVAEGETCTDPQVATTCKRGAQLMVRQGDALRWVPLNDAQGACIDTGWVELARSAEVELPNGWARKLDYVASLQSDPRYVIVTEMVTVNDRDTNDPATAPRLVRRIDTDRFLHLTPGALVSRQVPLWRQALTDWASLDRTPAAPH